MSEKNIVRSEPIRFSGLDELSRLENFVRKNVMLGTAKLSGPDIGMVRN